MIFFRNTKLFFPSRFSSYLNLLLWTFWLNLATFNSNYCTVLFSREEMEPALHLMVKEIETPLF